MTWKTLTAIAMLATMTRGSIVQRSVTCSDGTSVSDEACCALIPIVSALQNDLFANQCGDNAHASLRLTFHDAIGFSLSNPSVGDGADGSVLTFGLGSEGELGYPENQSLKPIANTQLNFISQNNINISTGDFIQLAGAVGLSNCPGAPQLQFLLGRPPPTRQAVDGTIPGPTDTVDTIISRFADAGISSDEAVALLAAHSVGASRTIDPSVSGAPFDSTPGLFDSQFFIETRLSGTVYAGKTGHFGEAMSPLPGELRLESDNLLATDDSTSCLWQANVDQESMVTNFASAMAKLAVIGQDTSDFIDCTDVIPTPAALPATATPHFPDGLDTSDLAPACAATPFPTIPTEAEPTSVAPVPSQ